MAVFILLLFLLFTLLDLCTYTFCMMHQKKNLNLNLNLKWNLLKSGCPSEQLKFGRGLLKGHLITNYGSDLLGWSRKTRDFLNFSKVLVDGSLGH